MISKMSIVEEKKSRPILQVTRNPPTEGTSIDVSVGNSTCRNVLLTPLVDKKRQGGSEMTNANASDVKLLPFLSRKILQGREGLYVSLTLLRKQPDSLFLCRIM